MATNQYDWSGKSQGAGYNPTGAAQGTNSSQAYAQHLDPAAASFASNLQGYQQTPAGQYMPNNTMGPVAQPTSWANNAAGDNVGYQQNNSVPLPQTNYAATTTPQQYGAGTNQAEGFLGPTGAGSVGHFANVYDYADAYRRPWEAATAAPSGGGGGGGPLPNFDQNGAIVSIPQGVSWVTDPATGQSNWGYNGALGNYPAPHNEGNAWFAGATPIGQYTGAMPPNPYVATPSNPLGATPWLGVGGFRA